MAALSPNLMISTATRLLAVVAVVALWMVIRVRPKHWLDEG
jgi:hypothetical protein